MKDKDNRQVNCLAFADNIAMTSKREADARKQYNNMSKVARKKGLRIAYKTLMLNTTMDWDTREYHAKVEKFK